MANKPSSLDARHARHGIMENIDAARQFAGNPALLDESSSEYLFTEDDLQVADDKFVAQEVGDGCLRRHPTQSC